MDFMNYIAENALVLIPVIYIIGMFLKGLKGVSDKYILQEGFIKDGKKIQAITYKADFKVMYANGLEEVIDVKGKLTESFKIKRKMLLYKYRDIDFKCLQEKGRKPNKYWVQIL